MMWLLGGVYCLAIWLVFDKLRLLRLSLPIAIVAASVGPALILALLFCAQYYHPYTSEVRVFQKVVPIAPQLKQTGRVSKILVEPNEPIKQGAALFEVDSAPYQRTVERSKAAVAEAKQGVAVAEAAVEVAKASIKRTEADLKYMTAERDRKEQLLKKKAISQEEFDRMLAQYQQASSALDQARATLAQSQLSVERAKEQSRQAQVQLEDAKYDLDQTTVRAPADGYVTNLQLQPGALVGGAGGAVMSFVQDRSEADLGVVVAMIGQKNYLLVKPDQYAEVMLSGYPGRVFAGRVQTVIDVTGGGQLAASGDLNQAFSTTSSSKFAVRILLDDADSLRLPAGASGYAAVYTDNVPIAGIPIMFVMRAQSWLAYLF